MKRTSNTLAGTVLSRKRQVDALLSVTAATILIALTGCTNSSGNTEPSSSPENSSTTEAEAPQGSAPAGNACALVQDAFLAGGTGTIPDSTKVSDVDVSSVSAIIPGLPDPNCVWEYSLENGAGMKGLGVNYFGKPESYIEELGQKLSAAGFTGGPANWSSPEEKYVHVYYLNDSNMTSDALDAAGGPFIQLVISYY